MTVWILTIEAYHETEIVSVHATEAGGVAAWEAKRKDMIGDHKLTIQHCKEHSLADGRDRTRTIDYWEQEIAALEAAEPYGYCYAHAHPVLEKYEVKP